MARYEGMEDLLQRVRERMGVMDRRPHPGSLTASVADRRNEHSSQYASLLEAMLLVLRDAEQLRDQIEPGPGPVLSDEQREDLVAILGKALRELYQCKAALEYVQAVE